MSYRFEYLGGPDGLWMDRNIIPENYLPKREKGILGSISGKLSQIFCHSSAKQEETYTYIESKVDPSGVAADDREHPRYGFRGNLKLIARQRKDGSWDLLQEFVSRSEHKDTCLSLSETGLTKETAMAHINFQNDRADESKIQKDKSKERVKKYIDFTQ